MIPVRARTGLLLALTGCLGACVRGPAGPAADPQSHVLAGEDDRPYVAGSPEQREVIDGLVARLGVAEGDAFLELARRLAGFGERAVPALLGALASPDPVVRAEAVYVLGGIKDRRAIPAIADAATGDPVPRVRYEAAASLLGLRDARGLEVLVGGLEDPDARLRGKCAEILQEETGRRLGYEPDDPPDARAEAVRRWRAWLAARAVEPPAPEEPSPAEGDGGTPCGPAGPGPAVPGDAPAERR